MSKHFLNKAVSFDTRANLPAFFIGKKGYASTLSFRLSPLHHLFAVDDLQLRHDDALSKKRGKREATDGRFPVLGFIARKARFAWRLQRPRIVYKPRTDTLLVYARNSSRSSLAAHIPIGDGARKLSGAEVEMVQVLVNMRLR